MIDNEDIKGKIEDLKFAVRRSSRYHNRRRDFFDRYQTIAQTISVLFGSATFITVISSAGRWLPMLTSAIVATLSAISLAISPTKKSQQYTELYKRWIDLEKEITSVKCPTEEGLGMAKEKRLEIERDEPPTLKALDAMCYNDQLHADDRDTQYLLTITWYQRLFANIVDINAHKIKPQSSDTALDRRKEDIK